MIYVCDECGLRFEADGGEAEPCSQCGERAERKFCEVIDAPKDREATEIHGSRLGPQKGW